MALSKKARRKDKVICKGIVGVNAMKRPMLTPKAIDSGESFKPRTNLICFLEKITAFLRNLKYKILEFQLSDF